MNIIKPLNYVEQYGMDREFYIVRTAVERYEIQKMGKTWYAFVGPSVRLADPTFDGLKVKVEQEHIQKLKQFLTEEAFAEISDDCPQANS